MQVEAPTAEASNATSLEDVSRVGVDLEALKGASQTYIQQFVNPLNRATLKVVSRGLLCSHTYLMPRDASVTVMLFTGSAGVGPCGLK